MPEEIKRKPKHKFTSTNQPKGNGRKKGSKNISTTLKKLLQVKMKDVTSPLTKKTGNMTIHEMITTKLIADAIKGDKQALKIVLERSEGSVPQQQTVISQNADIEPNNLIGMDDEELNGIIRDNT